MLTSLARFSLLAAALATGAAVAQNPSKPRTTAEQASKPTAQIPTPRAELRRFQGDADKSSAAQPAHGRYTGTMDCRGGGMDVELKVLRANGVEQYGLELIFRGDSRQGRGVCTIAGDFRPEGLLDGKARLSFLMPLTQLRELSIVDGRIQRIRTQPASAGQFVNAAINDGWFRVRVREVQDVGDLPLYIVDAIVEERL